MLTGRTPLSGNRAVARNGYLPTREILTPLGAVEVHVPKVRDRSGTGAKFNSALAPPYMRRSKAISAALPWLYLKGAHEAVLAAELEHRVRPQQGAKGLSVGYSAVGDRGQRLAQGQAGEPERQAPRKLDDRREARQSEGARRASERHRLRAAHRGRGALER